MLTLDAAFDRIGSALRQIGYIPRDPKPPDSSGNRVAVFASPNMSVRVCAYSRARLLTIQVGVEGEWVDFAKRGVGAEGIEEAAVESLVRKVRNEVEQTSTDSD